MQLQVSGDSSSWKKTITMLENKVAEANRSEANKATKISQLEASVSALQSDLRQKDTELYMVQSETKTLQEMVENERQRFERELDALRIQQKEELNLLETNLDAAEKDHAAKVLSLQRDKDSMEALLATFRQQIESAQVSFVRANTELLWLCLSLCFGRFQNENATLMSETAKLDARNVELEASLKQAKQMEAFLQAQVHELEGVARHNQSLQEELQTVKSELDTERASVAQRQAQEIDKKLTAARQDQLLSDYRRKLAQVTQS